MKIMIDFDNQKLDLIGNEVEQPHIDNLLETGQQVELKSIMLSILEAGKVALDMQLEYLNSVEYDMEWTKPSESE